MSGASAHLARLMDEGLVAVREQGRHRYFRVSDADVARALEALSLVAVEHGYRTTPAGLAWLHEIGLDPKGAGAQGERFAYPCLDWSERRDHLAGRLATTLLDHFLARRWLVRVAHSRALKLTQSGRRSLLGLP